MKTLILDSSTNLLYTALLEQDEIIYESYIKGKNDHASAIVVEINEAIKKANIELKNLNRIIVGYGPGSYTGVRMAVTVGKMIATLEPSIKLYTISTLLLMASGIRGRVCSMIDARRNNCFGCIFDTISEEYCIKEAFIEADELLKNAYEFLVTEAEFKVDPHLVMKLATLVEEPRLLVPHYLRDTEAERNLNA